MESEENKEWYSEVKRASAEFNEVLKEAKLETGGNLSPGQIDRLFKLMKRLAHNRALSRLLYEENSLTDFNDRLRMLFYDRSLSIATRVNQFRELKNVKEVTLSHFLCLKNPAEYPFISTETYQALRVEKSQERAAEAQALSEQKIASVEQWHKTTIDYLADWVVFRAVKDELKLEAYPLVNRILWDAYVSEGEVERPATRTRRELELYVPVANELQQRATGARALLDQNYSQSKQKWRMDAPGRNVSECGLVRLSSTEVC